MPAPLARGLIITVSILLAAGLAAYENDQVRAWIDRTRHKIAMGIHSLGDERRPPQSTRRTTDPSMMEEKSQLAEERRRQAREEIMQRARVMDERRKRRKLSDSSSARSPSFDSLVDKDGMLLNDLGDKAATTANTSAIEPVEQSDTLRSRHALPMQADPPQSEGLTLPVRQLSQDTESRVSDQDPFESQYEQEMRSAWNLLLPSQNNLPLSSHASESLIDLTPTTEDIPDPDISVPSDSPVRGQSRSDYFSTHMSRTSSHTLSDVESDFYYAHPSRPLEPVEPRRHVISSNVNHAISSASSVAGSTAMVNASEVEGSEDDLLSDFGDGIHTPASAWTEVGSSVSGDD